MSKPESEIKHTFKVAGMHCANCALGIELELEELPGVTSAEASVAHGVATVTVDSEDFDFAAVVALIRELGYGVIAESPAPSSPAQLAPPERKPLEPPECHQ